jgi:uncharacterized protein (TIGR03435 family)
VLRVNLFSKLLWSAVVGLGLGACECRGQVGASSSGGAGAGPAELAFEVASVRENRSGISAQKENFPLGPGDVYAATGGVFSATNVPLILYITFAYKITNNEALAMQKVLPERVSQERYDIQARSEKKDPTKDEMRLMMRSLLAERFKLVVHTETREVPVFALTLVKAEKTGPKLQAHPAGDSCSSDASAEMNPGRGPAPPEAVVGGFPVVCGGILYVPGTGVGRLSFGARNVTMAVIANAMPSWGGLGRPVVDKTGLTGMWDFAMEFTPEGSTDTGNSTVVTGPTFLQALKEQLGLKLDAEKDPVDSLVVDHVERPSAN